MCPSMEFPHLPTSSIRLERLIHTLGDDLPNFVGCEFSAN